MCVCVCVCVCLCAENFKEFKRLVYLFISKVAQRFTCIDQLISRVSKAFWRKIYNLIFNKRFLSEEAKPKSLIQRSHTRVRTHTHTHIYIYKLGLMSTLARN